MDHGTQVLGSELQGLSDRDTDIHACTPSPPPTHLCSALFRSSQMHVNNVLGSFWNKEVFFLLGLHSGVFYLKHGALVVLSTPL